MRLADAHCHLQDERFDDDREAVITASLEQLEWIVIIGDDLKESRQAVELSRDRVYATVGMHPHHASTWCGAARDELRALAQQPGVQAYGEIGLDYHYDFSPRDAQRAAFADQMALAADLRLPVVIHSREAESDTMTILKEHVPHLPAAVMHCFGGDAPFAEKCLELGLYVSFAGNLTFPKAQPLRDAAAVVPLDRLMVETDAPYLAPKPKRGRRCEPVFVDYTARCLAEVKGVSFEEIAAATTRNAAAFYRIG